MCQTDKNTGSTLQGDDIFSVPPIEKAGLESFTETLGKHFVVFSLWVISRLHFALVSLSSFKLSCHSFMKGSLYSYERYLCTGITGSSGVQASKRLMLKAVG